MVLFLSRILASGRVDRCETETVVHAVEQAHVGLQGGISDNVESALTSVDHTEAQLTTARFGLDNIRFWSHFERD